MRNKWLVAIVSLALILGLVAIQGCAKPTPTPEKFTFKFQCVYATTSNSWEFTNYFSKHVEEATDGAVTFELFPAGAIVPTKESLDGLVEGTIDLLISSGSYYSGSVPGVDYMFIPRIVSGPDEIPGLYKGKIGDIIRKAYLDYGVVHLTHLETGKSESFLMTKGHPVKALDDLKGLKMRGAGGAIGILLKALGTVPVMIPTGELYTAMQRGTIDGMVMADYWLETNKLKEVVFSITSPAVVAPLIIDLYMSKSAWDKLPKKYQAIIMKVAEDTFHHSVEFTEALDTKRIEGALKEYNIPRYTLSAADIAKWDEIVKNTVLPEWAQTGGAAAQITKILRAK